MGSLFVVECPTREYETKLRQKEIELLNQTNRLAKGPMDSGSLKMEPHFPAQRSSMGGLGVIISDDDTVSRMSHRGNSSISELDIQSIIDSIHLEEHLEESMKKFFIYHAVWALTVDERLFQVTFTVPQSKAEKIIHHLQTCGFGTKYESCICVSGGNVYLADESYKYGHGHKEPKADPTDKDSIDEDDTDEKKRGHWNTFVASIKSRLTVAQVVQTVTNNAALTFDYMTLIFVAAAIASLGLLENNSVSLVASMLISPLMSPIMAFVFSCVIHDLKLMKLGASGAAIGLAQCLVVGVITGVCIESKPFQGPWADVEDWPTDEMIGRAQIRSLIVGALIAIPSGVGVALSILAGNSGSLVGVAISASLLPPAVNCGVFWGMTLVVTTKEMVINHKSVLVPCSQYLGENPTTYYMPHYNYTYCKNAAKEYALMGTYSLLLTLINIVLIFIFAIIILRIKEFAPYTTRKNLHRFWKEDLKAVREYNAAHGGETREEDIINDINAVENPDELRQDIADDAVFKTINKKTGGTIQDLTLYGNKAGPGHAQATPTVDPSRTGWFGWWNKKPPEIISPEEPHIPEIVEETKRRVIIRRPTET